MTPPEDYKPIVTRLPEALAAEAAAIHEAEVAQRTAEIKRELAETDQERLERESGE